MPRALGRNLRKADTAFAMLKGMLSRRIPHETTCNHAQRDIARDVRIFIKDGHLASPKALDSTLWADHVIFCANPCCEHVFEVKYRGFKVRREGESGQAMARGQDETEALVDALRTILSVQGRKDARPVVGGPDVHGADKQSRHEAASL